MKKSLLKLIPMFALSGAAFGQTAAELINPAPAPISVARGTHQFTFGGQPLNMNLCVEEICRIDRDGRIKVEAITSGSEEAVLSHAVTSGSVDALIFYPAGKQRDPAERRILRNKYVIKLASGKNLGDVQARLGIKSAEFFQEGSDLIVCEEDSASRALSQIIALGNDPDIKMVEPIFTRKRFKRAVPTDPFYDTLSSPESPARDDGNYQWYLNNEGANGGEAGIDINIEPALDRATGDGVTVAVVDDGLSIDHIDLAANVTGPHLNVFAANETDPLFNDPTTLDANATHGTGVAALIAAEWNNNEGISGAAPEAGLAGIRLLQPGETASDVSDLLEAQALSFSIGNIMVDDRGRESVDPESIEIFNNSWGPSDETTNFERPGSLTLEALRNGALNGRAVENDEDDLVALGNIFVWAAGDGGTISDNSNYDGYANSIYTIAVGAVNDQGVRALYSEPGANLVVVAPSDGGGLGQDVLTASYGLDVDDDDNPIRTSEYITDFTGTSASAALVSGVVALMLEQNPELSWREVQDILIRSARKIDESNGWITNGAGIEFNHLYGSGLVDASAAVKLAADRGNEDGPSRFLGEQVTQRGFKFFDPDGGTEDTGIIPDGSGSSFLTRFNMAEDADGNAMTNLRVEHVLVQLRIVTQSRSELEVVLISPNGTQSELLNVTPGNDEQSITNWTFSTVRNWGEGSAGTWILRVTDQATGNPAQLNFATLIINGSEDPDAPISQGPVVTSSLFIPGSQNTPLKYQLDTLDADTVTVGELPPGLEYDPVTQLISGTPTRPGLYSIKVVLDGETGQTEQGISVVIAPTSVALGDAIGLPGVPAVFGGEQSWDFELDDTNDDPSLPDDERQSARSGSSLRDNAQSILGFNGIEGGVILFDWRTSSEEGADRLWFNFGGEVPQNWKAFISGERDWGTTAIPLNDGLNSVRWIYSKNGALIEGEDRGLIDNVRIVSKEKYLADVARAANISGFDFEMTSKAWFIPTETALGSDSGEGTARELLRSPTVGNGQTVSISGTLEGPGNFSLLAINLADTSDVVEFLLDGVVVGSREGIGGREGAPPRLMVNQDIRAGSHEVELRFRKDFRASSGRTFPGVGVVDGIFLDNMIFTPEANFGKFLANLGPGFGTDPDTDQDSDGYTNFEEYAFGGNLAKSDVPKLLPKVLKIGNRKYIEFGIDRSRTDLKYEMQQSSDLENWVEAEFETLNRTKTVSTDYGDGVPIQSEVDYYRIPVVTAPGRTHLFYRVVATAK